MHQTVWNSYFPQQPIKTKLSKILWFCILFLPLVEKCPLRVNGFEAIKWVRKFKKKILLFTSKLILEYISLYLIKSHRAIQRIIPIFYFNNRKFIFPYIVLKMILEKQILTKSQLLKQERRRLCPLCWKPRQHDLKQCFLIKNE